jgi:hypothetical protein
MEFDKMIKKIAMIGAAGLLAMSVASAQNNPPPGNVNPGSMKSGAEQSGAENQPRSRGDQRGTTGAAPGERAAPGAGRNMEKNSSPESTAGGAAGTSKGNNRPQ